MPTTLGAAKPILAATLMFGLVYASHAAVITATYRITADDFVDSNMQPPPPPASTSVSGDVRFTFDTGIPQQNDIMPATIVGFDITDRDGTTKDYDQTNSGVNTDLNIFTDFGRLTYGGLTNSVAFMVGLSDDMRVSWDINLTNFEVTSVFENFTYVTTVDPFYVSRNTTVELISVSPAVVPIAPAAPLFLSGLGMLGVMLFGRKRSR